MRNKGLVDTHKPPTNPGKHTTQQRQQEMLSDIEGYIHKTNPSIPTSIFLEIAKKVNLRLPMLMSLMQEWENCPSSGIRNSKEDRTHARSNINKDLLNPNGTWDALERLLRVIRVVKIELNIKVHFNWRKPVDVGLKFNTGVPNHREKLIYDASISKEEAKK